MIYSQTLHYNIGRNKVFIQNKKQSNFGILKLRYDFIESFN